MLNIQGGEPSRFVKEVLDSFNLLIVSILIALTAFFVAAEFSIIRVRGTRMNQMVEEGQ